MGIFKKFFEKLKYTFKKTELNDDFYDELESVLVSSDMGVETALDIMDELRLVCKQKLIKDADSAQVELKNLLISKLNAQKVEFSYPLIITVVGVNGVGKTTSIAKMTKYFIREKKSVLLAAGDTFRAAATEQLNMWAERLKTKIVKQGEGADSAAVVFDAVHSMKAKNTDVLIVDTAGRLHTKTNLMKELEKINNVASREYPEAKRLNLIVLDASIGQNSIAQVKAFKDSVDIDGIILTKLDGTAKGGVVYPIINELNVPIIFTGFGEGVDDLSVFDAESFVDKILM
ncbi:MAG: signal recognition particle-docking protein FtsY [Clostridiales bacterium]|nr:signal recognition particle-docking protein FtsY [Clostridiales bacterium]